MGAERDRRQAHRSVCGLPLTIVGTGPRTALMQMAAEELDVAFDRIDMVMGDTATNG